MHFLILILTIQFTSLFINAQISLIIDGYGIQFYPKNCMDTIRVTCTKNYPWCKMILFLQNCNGKSNFELFDKKGKIKIKGQFVGGKDTLINYSFTKTLEYTNGKKITGVRLLKYFYLLKSGT